MKIFTMSRVIRSSIIITLILVCVNLPVIGQEGSQKKAVYGIRAAEIIPGANFVLKSSGEDYPSSVKLNENNGITENGFVTWLKKALKTTPDVAHVGFSRSIEHKSLFPIGLNCL